MAAQAKSISLEDFTELTLKSVLRAMEVRSQTQRFPLGPIIFGIIWYPENFGPFGEAFQPRATTKEIVRKQG